LGVFALKAMSDTTQILTRTFDAATPTRVRDYVDLLKPRVMSLVVFTGLVGVLIAPGHAHPFAAALAVLAIALGSGAAGAINMWYERDLDALMARTRNRPLPAGRVAPDDALGLGVLLSIFSILLMAVATNYVAAALLAAAILFYVFVYTIWLKRRTPQNIVIGGAAGAFPPMIGWAAVTGDVSAVGIALFLLIFLWTPPHFWALALYRSDDYRRAGVPMLPVVAGPRETKRQMLLYTLVLAPVALAPTLLGAVGWLYGGVALAMSLAFIGHAVAVWRTSDDSSGFPAARRMFRFSLLHLAVLFAALPLDRVVARMLVG
jgi:protoheme IX farnesyltransferase